MIRMPARMVEVCESTPMTGSAVLSSPRLLRLLDRPGQDTRGEDDKRLVPPKKT